MTSAARRFRLAGRAGLAGTASLLSLLSLVSLPIWTGPGCAGGRGSARPDVLLVTLDTTRADRLGCYGYGRDVSPHLDAIASEGILFERAFAQSALTPVSHASILTGLNPQRHGLRVVHAAGGTRLPATVPTLATVLGEAGWSTAAFLSAFTVSEHFGLDSGFDLFDNGLARSAEGLIGPTERGVWMWNVRANQRRSDETTDRAIEWLASAERPFFLWVHYWDPHDPQMLPPKAMLDRFVGPLGTTQGTDVVDAEAVDVVDEADGADMADGAGHPAGTGSAAEARAIYDAEIAWVDAQLGRLVDALKTAGRWDDMIVAVTADHGQGLGEHGWWHHRILYQEQLHLPLVLRVPDGPRGVRVDAPARSIDLFPTILEAAGVDPPGASGPEHAVNGPDGVSLAPLWSGAAENPRIVYADALNLYDLNSNLVEKRPRDDLLHCVVDWPHKLIYRPLRPEESELYDLAADPEESRNLYGHERDRALELLTTLERLGGFVDGPLGEGDADPEVLERLRALGYIGADDEDDEDNGGE